MTRSRHHFSSYVPSMTTHMVQIADGSFTQVAGIGTIFLTSTLSLSDILQVLNFS